MHKGIPYQQSLSDFRLELKRPLQSTLPTKDELLADYHPDYIAAATTRLKIGANSGDACHVKLAELLQSDARIDEVNLAGAPITETDVLVIGGGGAGATAALTAAQAGMRVILASKLRLGDSNTVMAEGGIQASIQKEDTPQKHFNDTVKAGHGCMDKQLVASMVTDGPEVIRWLIQQGMQFDMDEYGDLLTRRAGGSSEPRVVYYRDYTGLEMMRVLREAVRNSQVQTWDYSPAVELLSNEEGHCSGAVLFSLKDNGYHLIKAKTVIIATGGIGRMHLNDFPTSNHFGATGDGLVLAYRLGAKLRDLDSFQYHPSGLAFPHHLAGTLITEGVRSAGAYILNGHGARFVDELSTRDVVTAAILRECAAGRGVRIDDGQCGVWLDTPGVEMREPGILEKRFPKLLDLGRRGDMDPRQSPMLIYPTLHYQNGGVSINGKGRTNVPGLYCIGEVCGGIHGRNRLMGNSLLEIISFGRKAGAHAASVCHGSSFDNISIEHLSRLRRELTLAGMPLDLKGPMLFPSYAKFDMDSDYSGARKNQDLAS